MTYSQRGGNFLQACDRGRRNERERLGPTHGPSEDGRRRRGRRQPARGRRRITLHNHTHRGEGLLTRQAASSVLTTPEELAAATLESDAVLAQRLQREEEQGALCSCGPARRRAASPSSKPVLRPRQRSWPRAPLHGLPAVRADRASRRATGPRSSPSSPTASRAAATGGSSSSCLPASASATRTRTTRRRLS